MSNAFQFGELASAADMLAANSLRREALTRLAPGDGHKIDLMQINQRSKDWVRRSDDGNGFCKDMVTEKPEIDVKKALAKFIISTPSEDRYADKMIPEGCVKHLASYRRNPQVFFGHKSYGFPIGLSVDDSGNAGVEVVEGVHVRATCKFNLATKESEDVFRLVEVGALRTSSIGFIPHVATFEKSEEEEDAPKNQIDFSPWLKFTFKEWELYEWSIVGVPANSECVRLHLEKGFGGRMLAEPVRKYLEQFVVKSAPVVMSGFVAELAKDAIAEEKTVEQEPPAVQHTTGPIAPSPVPVAVVASVPVGLLALQTFVRDLNCALTNLKTFLTVCENTDVKTFVVDSQQAAQEACGKAWRLLGLLYPKQAKELVEPDSLPPATPVPTSPQPGEPTRPPVDTAVEEKDVESYSPELLLRVMDEVKSLRSAIDGNAKALNRLTGKI